VKVSTARQQQAQTGEILLQAAIGQVLFGQSNLGGNGGVAAPGPLIDVAQVSGRDLGYIDFLVPGMLGLTMMNLGLFSVAFGFVQLKRTGALRRLFATPTPPGYFLAAQVSSRLIMSMAQVLILLAIGLWFGLQLVGSLALILAVAVLGGIVFLEIGYAIAGWARNEDQAAPVANLVSLPMTFLSGVFFPREAMPDFLRTVTEFLPLTYLSDALRRVTNDGAGIGDIGGDLLGLAVWAVIAFALAVWLFKWE
jgi:ABC-2 type transport system permease protein